VEVRIASSRQAEVITLHVDRPVETAIIAADGKPPLRSPDHSSDLVVVVRTLRP
jgi:hypothetical protein